MSALANIVLLTLALLKTPVSAYELAAQEDIKEIQVDHVLETFLEDGYVSKEGEMFLITEKGKERAWIVASEES